MVKCLNIGKNIGKPIYRLVSSIYILPLNKCNNLIKMLLITVYLLIVYMQLSIRFSDIFLMHVFIIFSY